MVILWVVYFFHSDNFSARRVCPVLITDDICPVLYQNSCLYFSYLIKTGMKFQVANILS